MENMSELNTPQTGKICIKYAQNSSYLWILGLQKYDDTYKETQAMPSGGDFM